MVKIIAVGASTGGNVAMRHILTHLSASFTAPILYLNSHHPAEPAWLAQDSALPAQWVKDCEALAAQRVYVCPAGFFCRVEANDTIKLIPTDVSDDGQPRIDPFFESVAVHYGSDASAVVLSGKSADGAAGVLALRAKLGKVLVQDPASALHPELPSAALATGAVDHVLSVGAIAPFLSQLLRS
jgi:chemotaxis response regulator CheB